MYLHNKQVQIDFYKSYVPCIKFVNFWLIWYIFLSQAVRAAQDEQLRLKDVEINELKSVRMDLDRELRDVRTVADRVSDLIYNNMLDIIYKIQNC